MKATEWFYNELGMLFLHIVNVSSRPIFEALFKNTDMWIFEQTRDFQQWVHLKVAFEVDNDDDDRFETTIEITNPDKHLFVNQLVERLLMEFKDKPTAVVWDGGRQFDRAEMTTELISRITKFTIYEDGIEFTFVGMSERWLTFHFV